MLRINKIHFLIITFFALLFSVESFSQPGMSSPYTYFGVGYLSRTNNIRNTSMGGIGIGTRNPISINTRNAASLTAIDSNSFLFEGAAMGFYETLQTENVKEEMVSGSLSHISMGFPIFHWWKTSLGIQPYSNVDYQVLSYEIKEDIGLVQYEYGGSGGLNQFFWSNGIKPHKNISIGINASYVFGAIDKYQKVTFPDSIYVIGSKSVNSINISDVFIEFGIQYHAEIKKDINLVVGAIYQPEIDMSANKSFLSQSFLGEANQIEYFKDTIAYSPDEKGSVVFPTAYGFGFSIENVNKWTIGADYKRELWEDYSSFGENDSLKSSYLLAIGGEYIPNINSTNYLNRIDYRLGAKYSQSFLNIQNQQLNNYGITFGLGLPIKSTALRRSRAMINLGFEIGTRGTLENNLIKENYVNFYLGLIISEFWFMKRKYN